MRSRREGRSWQYDSTVYREALARVAATVAGQRRRMGWTQEEAADRCRMSTYLLQQVEAASTNVTMTTLARLAEGLQLDIGRLVAKPRRSVR